MTALRLELLGLVVLVGVGLGAASPSSGAPSGESIYRAQCAECHGPNGEGVAGKYDESLSGDRTLEALVRLVERTMPEDRPEACVGEDARAVATYIYDAFYSPAARARMNPARLDPVRLTVRQHRESLADVIGGFRPVHQATNSGGLRAEYFQSKGMNKKDRRAFERVDPEIAFDFGEGSPGGDIPADQFSIAWSGSLLAPETGTYDFRVVTPNGARLYLNSDLAAGDVNRRDDSDAKRQPALIDLWVSSGTEPREGVASSFLLGGRSYPLRFDYFKFKDKTASVRLEWKPPGGGWSPIPRGALSPESSSRVAAIGTPFPADDSSRGYERGTSVSKAWHEAVTKAAMEAAGEIVARLESLSGVPENATNRADRLKGFAATLAERAFRRPLSADLRTAIVDRQFEEGLPPELAVKRVALLVFTSPRFLYPDLGVPADDHTIASRLALALWDSVPDEALREAASTGALRDPARVRSQAERMLRDPRAAAKVHDFFRHWLGLDETDDLAKDTQAYPGFDQTLVADLRLSLERFVDEVFWSESSDYRQLLLADYLYLNPRLAAFYGAEVPADAGFVPVRFESSQRAGVLTHPLLLAAYSYHRSSSPIHRGVFLTRNILGRALKPPPMAIEFMDDRFDPSLTMRQKVTQLTAKEACMGCHSTINPLGFSLEHYDAVGRFRTEDNRQPVDAAADYLTTGGEVVRLRGPRDVAEHAVSDSAARRGFVRQWFQATLKQSPAAYGPETLSRLDAAFEASGHHLRRLLVEIAVTAAVHGLPPET